MVQDRWAMDMFPSELNQQNIEGEADGTKRHQRASGAKKINITRLTVESTQRSF